MPDSVDSLCPCLDGLSENPNNILYCINITNSTSENKLNPAVKVLVVTAAASIPTTAVGTILVKKFIAARGTSKVLPNKSLATNSYPKH